LRLSDGQPSRPSASWALNWVIRQIERGDFEVGLR
jgi:hypothetical protein